MRKTGQNGGQMAHWAGRGKLLSLFVWGLAAANLQAAPLRVIDETAIPFMDFLSKSEFDQRYPGKRVEEPSQLETGWYVIYEHESLNYFFGPILLESTGEDYLSRLSETVEAAVAERPSIQDYRLELSYEPRALINEPSAGQSPAEPSAPNSRPPQPAPQPSLWGFLKKIFGFG